MIQKWALVLIGPPGSGKSTIANRLTEDSNVTAVETGNLLRDEVNNNTDIADVIDEKMSSGKIVPSDIVKEVVERNLRDTKQEYILFDGFPRVPDQIDSFFEIAEDLNIKIKKVIILLLEDSVILKRLTGRRICENCGTIYNIHFDPPEKEDECTRCGGKLKRRKDDTPGIVKERIEFYKENTLKVADFYKKEYPDKIVEVEADRDIKVLTEELKNYIN
jgi:adenylate kinase